MTWASMNRRQRLFCDGVAAHGDPTRAYCDAYGFADATGRARREISKRASLLLSRPPIKEHLNALSGTGDVKAVCPAGNRSRATAAIGDEAVMALDGVSASDLALMADVPLHRLEILAHAIQQLASAEIDVRRGVVPRAALSRASQPDAAEGGARRCVDDHAQALLAALQRHQAVASPMDYDTVRRTYGAMLVDLGWRSAPWARVARALRGKTGGRKLYVNHNRRKVLMFDIPAGMPVVANASDSIADSTVASSDHVEH